jgi:SAM-dependent methyltransferase
MSNHKTADQAIIGAHFDEVSKDYDYWKKKNWFYYQTLYAIARRYAGGAARLLDVGCGTGAMMEAVAPAQGVGIDVSPGMIAVAKTKYAHHAAYAFEVADIVSYTSSEKFNVILCFDVVEHLSDVPRALASLKDLLSQNGTLVLVMANPLWEPILMFAERRGLKMPEGPHYRMPDRELLLLASKAGLKLEKREWHLLFPKYIPWFSWFCNEVVGRLPLIKRLAVVEVFIFSRA